LRINEGSSARQKSAYWSGYDHTGGEGTEIEGGEGLEGGCSGLKYIVFNLSTIVM
jgi:hypothetical protein